MTREEAQQRNWLKGRLMGLLGLLNPGRAPLTDIEKQMFKEMKGIRDDLIDQWDDSTEAINGKPLPEYKCFMCGKRGHKKYEIQWGPEIKIVCRKHYNEAVETPTTNFTDYP